LRRRRGGQVKVVEHEHERSALREPLEQRAYGPVNAVALMLKRNHVGVRPWRQRWKHVRKLGLHITVESSEPSRFEALKVLVERVDEHSERQVSLELRRRPRQ